MCLQLDRKYNQFRLKSILSEHKKTISAIAWNPRNPNIFATASYENKIIVWDVNEQKPIATFDNLKNPPIAIDWCLLHGEAVSYIHGRGPLYMWQYKGTTLAVSSVKESSGFSSEVLCFKWHPKKFETVVFGHKDGSISLCTLGKEFIILNIIPHLHKFLLLYSKLMKLAGS